MEKTTVSFFKSSDLFTEEEREAICASSKFTFGDATWSLFRLKDILDYLARRSDATGFRCDPFNKILAEDANALVSF